MTEYCRLCAELKDSDEIVASIDDVGQSMERKLRVCCQWTNENTEHQLPHSVCSICLDKLDKCWLFAQSVQLAQQRLLEIFETNTKPLAANLVRRYSNDLPTTSTVQSNRFTAGQLVRDQHESQTDHKCKICSQEFRTDEELNGHQRQGCDELFGSIFVDCKPMTFEFTDSQIDGGQTRGDNVRLNVTSSKNVLNQMQSDGQAVKRLYPCDKCDRVYKSSSGLYLHQNVHTGARTFKCEPCNKSFATNSSLKRHLLIHDLPPTSRTFDRRRQIDETIVRPFKCPLCDDSFATKFSLKRHMVIHVHRSNGELEIEKINNRFQIIQANGGGEPIDVGKNLYECGECEHIFASQFELKFHRTIHSNERSFECWLCHKTFKANRNLLKHIKTHVRSKQNSVCEICLREFWTSAELNTHRQQGCEGPIKIVSIASDCKPTAVDFANEFHCDDNESIGNYFTDLDEQSECSMNANKNDAKNAGKSLEPTDSLPEQPQHECGVCGKMYAIKNSLVYHLRRKHNRNSKQCLMTNDHEKDYSVQIDGKRRFKCPLCDSTFGFKLPLKRHLTLHVNKSKGALKVEEINNRFLVIQPNGGGDPIDIGEFLCKCDECNQFFISQYELKLHHQLKHSNERPFECWLCHKTFRTRTCIKHHLKNHIPDGIKRNLICELCGKAFKAAFHLLKHVQSVHSDERPHKCETCGLGFKIENLLKVHRLRHTEVQFKCNQCEKSFRSKHSLKLHLETHTGSISKQFVCDFCGIGFRRNVDLKDHRRIHTGEMPYSCEHCTSKFRARSSYYSHLRTVHGISLLAQNRAKLAE